MQIEELGVEQCGFSPRTSVFQGKGFVILSTKMTFSAMHKEEVEHGIMERMKISKEKLDAGKPSCGTVFSKANGKIMKLLRGLRIGGACWSKKTSNWISNDHRESYRDIVWLLFVAKLLHKVTFQQLRQEIEVWK